MYRQRNTLFIIILFFLSAASLLRAQNPQRELEKLQQHYIQSLLSNDERTASLVELLSKIQREQEISDQVVVELHQRYPFDLEQINHYVETIREDGSWPDINYQDQKRSGWSVKEHADRILLLAKLYRAEEGYCSLESRLEEVIHQALDYWFQKKPVCKNWWYNEIGIPKVLGPVFLLMKEQLSPQEKQAAGVDVRIIYDDVGTLATLPADYAAQFEQRTGIPCCVFNRFKPVISIRMNNRDHRKLCIIDGHTAFTGGINLADEYINRTIRYGHWKDSAILVKGEAAWSMTVMFLTMWEYVREVRVDYPTLRPRQMPMEAALGGGCYVQPYADNPLDNEPVGENVYLNLINKARRYVYIMTPYLIVSHSVNTALCCAAKSGVDVRIMTPHVPDKRLVFELTRSHYQPLLEAGVHILEYTPGFVHAKNVVVDDLYAVVGTINMDYRSMFLHFENAVLLYQDPAILDIKADFLATQLQCTPISLEQCLERSWLRRLFRSILRVLAPLV